MDFKTFSEINRTRSEHPTGFDHKLESWSLSDWMVAVMGEAGETCNIIKKLNRVRDGIPGNTQSEAVLKSFLKDEAADIFCYLDLFCQAAGFSLEEAVIRKFNLVSKRMDCNIVIPPEV